MLVVPDDSELRMLELILLTDPLIIRLYTNDHAPADADLATSYVELARDGYRGIELQREEWVLSPGKPALGVHPAVRWRFPDGPEATARGYFVTWPTLRLAWVEPFKRAQIVEFEGDSITVVPKFSLRQLQDA